MSPLYSHTGFTTNYMLSTITVILLKFSLGVFLLRIVVHPVQRYIIHGTLVLVSLYTVAYFFLVVFQCRPVHKFVSCVSMTALSSIKCH